MDYDDNDTQCHNLQLAGDGRSKSSSVLRPYAFPKFDFDDSLQGHLRFDSLVESEVFLGIQSQDNQWIEDFSRGSNGIEFSSTATESCSISRRNNVWSEATSSESVEMLLKSVGQEEMVPGDTVVEESDNCDEMGCLAKQVEHTHQDGQKEECGMDSNASITQGEFLKKFPRLNVERELPQIEGTSQFQNSMVSAHESSRLGPNVAMDRCITSITEGNLFVGGEYADDNGAEFAITDAKFPVVQSSHGEAREEPLDSSRAIDKFNCIVGTLSTSENQQHVCGPSPKGAEGLIEATNRSLKEPNVSSQGTQSEINILEQSKGGDAIHVTESSLDFVPDADCASTGYAVEISSDSVRESGGMLPEDKSQSRGLQQSDKDRSCKIPGQPGCIEVELLSVCGEINHSFKSRSHDNYPVDIVDQNASEMGSADAGNHSSSRLKMDSVMQLTHVQHSVQLEDMPEGSSEKNSEVSVHASKPSSFPGEDNKASVCKSDSINHSPGVEHSDVAVLPPCVKQHSESEETEIVKDSHTASRLELEQPSDKVHPTSVGDGSGLNLGQAGVAESEQVVSVVKEDKECSSELPPGVRNIGFESAGTSQTVGKSIIVDKVVVHCLPAEMAAKSDSVNDVCPPVVGLNQGVVTDITEGEHGQASRVRLSHLNDDKEKAFKRSTDSQSSGMEGSAQVAMEADTVTQAKVGAAHDTAGALLSDMAGKPPAVREICDAVSVNEPPVVAVNSSKPHDRESDAHPGCHEPNSKENDSAGAVSAGSREEETMKLVHENTSVQPADSYKVECDSPTIISSNELSQSDKGNQEDFRGSEISNEFGKTAQSISEDPKGKDAAGDDGGFTFKVDSLPDLSDRENGRNWSPIPRAEICDSPMVVDGSTPVGPESTTTRRNPRGCDSEMPAGTSKSTSERKGRRGSGKGMSKENSKKANLVKETGADKSSGKGDKPSNVPLGPFGSSPHAKFAEMQPYGRIEQNNVKLSTAVTVPTSDLPDLNSSTPNKSTPPSSAFQQPFTDMQQVQLRAQIFVYGSLIQGTAPDEPCMAAAFGPSDGGRSVWEPVWRSTCERVRNQKSQSSTGETPLQSHSGARAHDLAGKQGSQPNRVLPSPVGQASYKAAPATIVNPIIPLSSPLWTISTPARDGLQSSGMIRGPIVDSQQVISPVHPYQSTLGRNLAGQTSWPSQSPFPGPWMSTPLISATDASARFSTVSITETVKLSPVKGSSGPSPTGVNFVTSSPVVHSGGLTTMFAAASSPLPETVKGIVSPQQHSADLKPRKRKKVSTSDDLGQTSVLSQAQIEPVVTSSVMTPSSSLVAIPIPACLPSRIDLSQSTGNIGSVSSVDQLKLVDLDSGKNNACSEESLNKVGVAKLQAEEAAASAASAVSHSQSVWSQLAKQKEAGFTSETEAKLASAAVAIAAAASVAKAAAAAAKIASHAALQAKIMADEAFLSSRTNDYTLCSGISSKDVQSMGKATPASILRADGRNNESSSILIAAKEAAKRRLEAASAASKQAENLDAIVKAAELAAESVSQAGKIVAMGDPLPLSELIAAGPEGYWKLPQVSSDLAVKLHKNRTVTDDVEVVADMSVKLSGNGIPDERCGQAMNLGGKSPPLVTSIDSFDGSTRIRDSNKPSTPVDEQDSRRNKSHNAFDTAKSSEVLPQIETALRTGTFQNEDDELAEALHENTIKDGSLVEVSKIRDGSKPGWFSARVLMIEDGKSFCSGNLKEWVSVEGEGEQVPRIRIARPLSGLQFKGARKRQRTAMGDYAWAVGDRVDALIQDWCVVTEKNEKEETTFTVHFPACGETSEENTMTLTRVIHRKESDKNWKKPAVDPGEKLPDVDPGSGNPLESNLLALSAGNKVFNVGRSSRDEIRPGAHRTLRTGSQKEGSRVIFGVPKPGKKRKFMEVSKHYPADGSIKKNEGNNDSVKFTKYLMPQGTVSRGWRNTSKPDSKEKQAVELKAKVPGSRRPPIVSSRTVPRRDNLINSMLAVHDDTATEQGTDIEDSVDRENVSEKSSLMEHVSSSCTEEAAEGPLSSLFGHQLDGSSKKMSTSINKSERFGKRRVAPSGGKLTKIEEDKVYNGNSSKSAPEVEPRRSNRRIQPTHRLLEGLQSALIISKIPSISHEKGHKNHSRSSSSRGK
ncbi:hypothetical protein Ancab_033266 [Ancistrocladus abbreviatus]